MDEFFAEVRTTIGAIQSNRPKDAIHADSASLAASDFADLDVKSQTYDLRSSRTIKLVHNAIRLKYYYPYSRSPLVVLHLALLHV